MWLNGSVVGHGPSKSAEGMRFVDEYDVTPLLRQGENLLEVLALSLGVSTMTYCLADAGLIFELDVNGQKIASDEKTLVRPDPRRRRRTVRRWILPCLEDVDATVEPEDEKSWSPAMVVDRQVELCPRRVPLPSRQALVPQRPVLAEEVSLPDFAISLRHKRYLTPPAEWDRHNTYATPGYIVTDIHSPVAQELQFVPTLGSVRWYHEGKLLFAGSGWNPWDPTKAAQDRIQLRAGANRLIGLHSNDHFEHVNLAGFVSQPVEFRNPFGDGGFQVIPIPEAEIREGEALLSVDWNALRERMPEMRAEDTAIEGNAYDLVFNARPVADTKELEASLCRTPLSEPLSIPSAPPGHAIRLMLDLGVLHNGWIELDVEGRRGARLILAFVEAIEPGPPVRVQWPAGCNNALTYRLAEGRQQFESFHPYGVRYLLIHNAGAHPLRIHALRVRTANCGSRPRGDLLTPDAMLNRIYQIAVQSVISGVDDTFTDCPTFEQVNWNFDNHTAWQGEVLSCANHAVASHSIRLFAEDPRCPGLVRSQYPSAWDNSIPLWSFHWILWCRDCYQHSGDEALVRAVFPRIAAGIEEALRKVGQNGLLAWEDTWHFVEWGHGRDDNHAINSAEQAGFAGAIGAAIELGRQLKLADEKQLARWQNARQRLIDGANELLWDPRRRAYADSLHADGKRSDVASQATNASMAIYGIADDARRTDLAWRIAADEPTFLPFGSPYGLYYVLELLDSVGDVETIFRHIRRRWGDMVRAGDTTTWEHFAEFGFSGFPTRSRCHPFAAYVIKYLVKYLLGVQLQDIAFRRFAVKPNPPEGMDRCEGSVPTPGGPIRVGWERCNNKIELKVEFPPALERAY
ncbi:MAG TPA: alpha-L-rhamnosidase [Phycisphaerales bacterium]|nr:alpha-L-rhamnosidase [Phycisphaerales bacterium]